jgi:hypothetical protein
MIMFFSQITSPHAGMATSGCDLNRSMQHLNSNCREKDVENETKTEDFLLRYPEVPDVGSVAKRRFYERHSPSF